MARVSAGKRSVCEADEPWGGAGGGPFRGEGTVPTSISHEGGDPEGSRPPEADRGVGVILRKEVIQPQVPLRLPCYDLVPITGFIFGACL